MGLAAAVGARVRRGLVETRGELGGARRRARPLPLATEDRTARTAARGRGGRRREGRAEALGGRGGRGLARIGRRRARTTSARRRAPMSAETASTIEPRPRGEKSEVASASTVAFAERLLLRAAVARDVDRELRSGMAVSLTRRRLGRRDGWTRLQARRPCTARTAPWKIRRRAGKPLSTRAAPTHAHPSAPSREMAQVTRTASSSPLGAEGALRTGV